MAKGGTDQYRSIPPFAISICRGIARLWINGDRRLIFGRGAGLLGRKVAGHWRLRLTVLLRGILWHRRLWNRRLRRGGLGHGGLTVRHGLRLSVLRPARLWLTVVWRLRLRRLVILRLPILRLTIRRSVRHEKSPSYPFSFFLNVESVNTEGNIDVSVSFDELQHNILRWNMRASYCRMSIVRRHGRHLPTMGI